MHCRGCEQFGANVFIHVFVDSFFTKYDFSEHPCAASRNLSCVIVNLGSLFTVQRYKYPKNMCK